MTINASGLALIKRFEGLRLAAYKDVAGIWSIGHGHIVGVGSGMTCTAEQADTWLQSDLAGAERTVTQSISEPLNENEYSALVSLAFNIGSGNFRGSVLRSKLNGGDHHGAADQITRWDKAEVDGKLVVVAGLTTRRAAERELFLKPVVEDPDIEC